MSDLVHHEQQGGISLIEFAARHDLSREQALYLARSGRILGAARQRNGYWVVFPPAVLLEPLKVYKRKAVVVEALQDARRPRTPDVLQGTGPLIADGVSPGALSQVFANGQTVQAVRNVRLAADQSFYPLVLSGAQMLIVERALLHEAEAVKHRLDFVDEFEPEARIATGDQLNTVYAVLRVLKQAAAVKNRVEVKS
jgi:hypothetical protein